MTYDWTIWGRSGVAAYLKSTVHHPFGDREGRIASRASARAAVGCWAVTARAARGTPVPHAPIARLGATGPGGVATNMDGPGVWVWVCARRGHTHSRPHAQLRVAGEIGTRATGHFLLGPVDIASLGTRWFALCIYWTWPQGAGRAVSHWVLHTGLGSLGEGG